MPGKVYMTSEQKSLLESDRQNIPASSPTRKASGTTEVAPLPKSPVPGKLKDQRTVEQRRIDFENHILFQRLNKVTASYTVEQLYRDESDRQKWISTSCKYPYVLGPSPSNSPKKAPSPNTRLAPIEQEIERIKAVLKRGDSLPENEVSRLPEDADEHHLERAATGGSESFNNSSRSPTRARKTQPRRYTEDMLATGRPAPFGNGCDPCLPVRCVYRAQRLLQVGDEEPCVWLIEFFSDSVNLDVYAFRVGEQPLPDNIVTVVRRNAQPPADEDCADAVYARQQEEGADAQQQQEFKQAPAVQHGDVAKPAAPAAKPKEETTPAAAAPKKKEPAAPKVDDSAARVALYRDALRLIQSILPSQLSAFVDRLVSFSASSTANDDEFEDEDAEDKDDGAFKLGAGVASNTLVILSSIAQVGEREVKDWVGLVDFLGQPGALDGVEQNLEVLNKDVWLDDSVKAALDVAFGDGPERIAADDSDALFIEEVVDQADERAKEVYTKLREVADILYKASLAEDELINQVYMQQEQQQYQEEDDEAADANAQANDDATATAAGADGEHKHDHDAEHKDATGTAAGEHNNNTYTDDRHDECNHSQGACRSHNQATATLNGRNLELPPPLHLRVTPQGYSKLKVLCLGSHPTMADRLVLVPTYRRKQQQQQQAEGEDKPVVHGERSLEDVEAEQAEQAAVDAAPEEWEIDPEAPPKLRMRPSPETPSPYKCNLEAALSSPSTRLDRVHKVYNRVRTVDEKKEELFDLRRQLTEKSKAEAMERKRREQEEQEALERQAHKEEMARRRKELRDRQAKADAEAQRRREINGLEPKEKTEEELAAEQAAEQEAKRKAAEAKAAERERRLEILHRGMARREAELAQQRQQLEAEKRAKEEEEAKAAARRAAALKPRNPPTASKPTETSPRANVDLHEPAQEEPKVVKEEAPKPVAPAAPPKAPVAPTPEPKVEEEEVEEPPKPSGSAYVYEAMDEDEEEANEDVDGGKLQSFGNASLATEEPQEERND